MRARTLSIVALFLLKALTLPAWASQQSADPGAEYLTRQDSLDFIEKMVQTHGFDRGELTEMFRGVVKRDELFELMERPAEKKPWYQYRPIFVTEGRASAGSDFWKKNEVWLERAQAEFGVPPEIIVAIIGVETRYGSYTGKQPVFDTLVTFAFDYPKRARFFQRELEQFLLLAREEGIDPREPTGSYAGAMGMPQFIASSYRAYAIDFDGDGRRDLWHSPADVIGSVANYFARHGWRNGGEVLRPASVEGSAWRALEGGLRPRYTLAEMERVGVRNTGESVPPDTEVTLIALEFEDGERHVLGLHNFYVITRYNHSELYAMAAWELSQLVRRMHHEQTLAKGEE
jgi:membrane-bound lytic murein transglycosylase B